MLKTNAHNFTRDEWSLNNICFISVTAYAAGAYPYAAAAYPYAAASYPYAAAAYPYAAAAYAYPAYDDGKYYPGKYGYGS